VEFEDVMTFGYQGISLIRQLSMISL